MRSAVARRPPAVRKRAAPRAVRAVAAPAARGRVAPRAIQIVAATVVFLIAYAVLTAMHARHRDPDVARSLSPIPLFARIAATTVLALPAGLLADRLVPARWLRAAPALLAVAIVVASLAILVFA